MRNTRHTLLILTALLLFPALAPAALKTLPLESEQFEQPPVLRASQYLSPGLYESPFHKVDEDIPTSGFTNKYTVISKFGTYRPHGNTMLAKRVNELHAINRLRKMRTTDGFTQGAENAAKGPLSAAKNLITDPVDTITGVPKGIWNFMENLGEMTKGGRSKHEEGVTKELIGFASAKRKLAYDLGVDVYSDNKTLQKELNSVAWANYSGGFIINAAMLAGPRFLVVTKNIDRLNQLLRDSSPEDLRRINRERLMWMNMEPETAEALLDHPLYSPRHETFLAGSLYEMKGVGGRAEFVQRATEAKSTNTALIFQKMAELMYEYHSKVDEIERIVTIRRFPMGVTRGGALFLPFVCDYEVWSPQLAKMVNEMVQEYPEKAGSISRIELWTTGTLSQKAKDRLSYMGFDVQEKAFEYMKDLERGTTATDTWHKP